MVFFKKEAFTTLSTVQHPVYVELLIRQINISLIKLLSTCNTFTL